MKLRKRRAGRMERAGCALAIAIAGWFTAETRLNAQQHGTDPVQLDTGARVYSSTCSACHGPDGVQVSGVELKKGSFRHAATDDELARVIQNGIPGTAMPPNNITSQNLIALMAYLHAMRDFKTKKVAMGDARSGRVIFEG